ncbi:helix-turn-helix domain-containing protein [Tepidibacillus fermentans]|uniref:Helix-turn-helix protein n=1 Tax=Tepidibacillus fermentans TaxID=1281767 RepID=A0A4R3KB54_9BACI|nr:helix-turn-helix domain-containing protein [Tepidibacillus fermentans]TCS80366.1 helix-turn-helix protein [Tepidibacillus fermentans]
MKNEWVNPLFLVYTAQEAAELWGLAEPTVRQWIRRGKFREDEVRKSAGTWLVTHEAMERLVGKIKNKEEKIKYKTEP